MRLLPCETPLGLRCISICTLNVCMGIFHKEAAPSLIWEVWTTRFVSHFCSQRGHTTKQAQNACEPSAMEGRGSKEREPAKYSELIVVVVDAQQLPAVDRGGTSDPFVTVSVKQDGKKAIEKSTKEIKKTLNPKWNARLKFAPIDNSSAHVQIVIKDWNLLSSSKPLGCLIWAPSATFSCRTMVSLSKRRWRSIPQQLRAHGLRRAAPPLKAACAS